MLARTLSLLAGAGVILAVLALRGLPVILLAKGAFLLALLVVGIVLIGTAFSTDD